tara:strand:- start:30 stop:503 length:474 start_codon:yes stop_codon:yes gene_type:complete
MRLFIVRHGDALSKEADPQRGLSESGKEDVANVAAFLKRGSVQVEWVSHSGKKRAWETAEIFRECLIGNGLFDERDGLGPLDPVVPLVKEIQNLSKYKMFVGHLPFVSKLVSHLITGNEDIGVVSFSPGTIVCLERDGDEIWSVAWVVRPELLKSLN